MVRGLETETRAMSQQNAQESLTVSIREVARLLHPKATITSARQFVRENRIPIAFRSGRGGSWFVPRQAVIDAIGRMRA